MDSTDLFGLAIGGIVVLLWLWGAVRSWQEERQARRKTDAATLQNRLAA